MKKVITIITIFAMVLMGALTSVNAATNDSLPDELYAIGAQYGMKESDKLRMVKYLTDYPLSNADCDRVLALAQEADGIMKENGTTDYKSLPADVKSQLKGLANSAATIAGVTLDFKSDGIDVYKGDKLIDSIRSESTNKLVPTGNNNIVLVVSSIAVIALAAVAARKKLANA